MEAKDSKEQYPLPQDVIAPYLADCRALFLDELRNILPEDTAHTGGLYAVAGEYPFRDAKGLRPALAIATCRALGGLKSAVVPSAAVLELYHNAFLIHDDIEDGSETRRSSDTLYKQYGMPIAVNAGDSLLALTMQPLLDNMQLVGVGRAIRILQTISTMARETAEGQMLELSWIRNAEFNPSKSDYIRMVHKKTSWYSFIAPTRIGAIAAGLTDQQAHRLSLFALYLGVVFQIRDDLLNLEQFDGDISAYGKESWGDLWEGKFTLMLIHTLSQCTDQERQEMQQILAKPRIPLEKLNQLRELQGLLHHGPNTQRTIALVNQLIDADSQQLKQPEDITLMMSLIRKYDGVGFASQVAQRWFERGLQTFEHMAAQLPHSQHIQFLREIYQYAYYRNK